MSAAEPNASSLAHYEQVSLYETAFKSRREDVRFFVRLADRIGGPILEYGAGAGRITLPLARAGHEVTAVDASEPMVQRLKARLKGSRASTRERVRVVSGDMRTYRAQLEFSLVLATFNVVGHLSTFADFSRFLKRAKAHLTPGGLLAFDVPIPHPEELEADPEEWIPAPRFKHPDTGEWIRQTERFVYAPAQQLLTVDSRYRPEGSKDALQIPLILRQWFPKELESLLLYEGFASVEAFADYSEQPALVARDSLVFTARAPG